MTHKRIDILRKLLTLTQIHLKLVLEEKWEDWELMAHQKKDLYKQLMAARGPSTHPEEKEIIDSIQETEKKTLEELTRKRDETRKELVEIDRFAGGMKNYRHSHKEVPKRHFSIKC